MQHTYYADANVEAMGDLDDEKRDLFGAVFFVFLLHQGCCDDETGETKEYN